MVWAGSRHSLEKRESSYNTAKAQPAEGEPSALVPRVRGPLVPAPTFIGAAPERVELCLGDDDWEGISLG